MSAYTYLMGLDGGGTKSEALLVRSDGRVCGWGHCDATEAGTQAVGGRSPRVVQTAISRAIKGLPAAAGLTLHYAGIHLKVEDMLPKALKNRVCLKTSMESLPMLSLVPERMGLVALAGTGAHVSGQNRQGQISVCDGLGPNFGDLGGASRIGVQALRAAAMDSWHSRHRTSLGPLVQHACKELDGNSPDFHLIGFFHKPRDRWQIASLARIVDEEAEGGDRIARQILEESAESMAEVIFDVADTLSLCRCEFPLIGMGSVITHSRIFWTHLCRCVTVFAPQVRPCRLLIPPVFGIVLDALLSRDNGDFEGVRANLLSSASDFIPDWPDTLFDCEKPKKGGGRGARKYGALDCFIRK
jgi:N-acetylglucosamine kinase-like BadF-type ATPase